MLLPSHLTKYVAILSPRPVFTNPRAKKKEMTINQMTSLVNAAKAVGNASVLVTIEVVRPRKAHAPTGNGLKTRPAIVERKIERSCHACGETSTGLGTRKRRMRPMEMEITKGSSLAPRGGGGDGKFVGGTVDAVSF